MERYCTRKKSIKQLATHFRGLSPTKAAQSRSGWLIRMSLTLFLAQPSCSLNGNRIWGQLGSNPSPPGPSELTLGELAITKLSTNAIQFTLSYSGDSNNNSQVSVHFCSIKAQAGCEPIGSEVITLTKSSSGYEGTVNFNSTAVTPGDFLKYKVVAADEDGLISSEDDGFAFIPFGGTQGIGVLQLNDFALPRKQHDLSFGGSDKIYGLIIDSASNIFLAGATSSSVTEPRGGGEDLLIIKLTPDGSLDSQFGRQGIVHLGQISCANCEQSDTIRAFTLDTNGKFFLSPATQVVPWVGPMPVIPMALSPN
jgi:hypothetical protein